MKKTICLLVLFALIPSVHADKKKKQPEQPKKSTPAQSSGGGGAAGGGTRLPNISRGNSAPRSTGQPGNASSAPRINTHTATSATNRMNTRSTSGGPASNPTASTTGQAGGNEQSSNPLMKKNAQPGSNAHASNPLLRKNQQAGANQSNPLAKKNAQPGMNGRNPNMMTRGNNPNRNPNRAFGAQAGRGFNNRVAARNWQQRGYHSNYHVRNYRDVFHNYHPIRHDRGWYHTHYDRVAFVGGGYYYWDGGYWYPAWGYDPVVAVYAYDGPIYSYDNLPPDQVIVNVQTELQDQGYYTGNVDGQLGPQTRDALGAYQADHNLEVTSAVDEPTVESLGLTESA